MNDPLPPLPDASAASERIMSVDVLRGFDMIWIIGLEDLVAKLYKAAPNPVTRLAAEQLQHKTWEGFAFYDLIFPLFVFLSGLSIVFSLGRIVAQGGRSKAFQRVLTRSLAIYLLGVFSYGGIAGGLERVRWVGVLQRIASSYFAAATLFLLLKGRAKPLALVCFGILVAYWAFLSFVPVPGGGADPYAEGANWANYIDKHWLPGRRWDGEWDPEGLLSSLPAVSTCLLGVFAGQLLKHPGMSDLLKTKRLALGGIVLVAAGFAWGLHFPVIKKLWSPSYVLVAGGLSYLLLGAFFLVVDVLKIRGWTKPFLWVGMNAITAYMVNNVVKYEELAHRIAGGEILASLGNWGEVVIQCVVLVFALSLLRFLYRRSIFLRL